jgi:glucose/arabinose dehydrogenase
MRRILLALAVLAPFLTATQAHASVDPRNLKVTWAKAWSGLSQPVAMTHPPNDKRLFVVQRSGKVRVIRNGVLKATPFLDLSGRVNTEGEGGLLSIAFKPDYARTGRFFVAYVDSHLTFKVRRYANSDNPADDVAGTTGVDVLSIAHPGQTNHFGGQLAFGPGGYLFVGTGDGGGGGDPGGNAQDLGSLLGKILRINVSTYTATSTTAYSSPSTNPYYGSTPGRAEIWASGLRNPWRFSFDRGHDDLWVGDVGEDDREEVNRFTVGGHNLGWDCREGTLNVAAQYGGSYCKSSGYLSPLHEYTHSLGCAIIGGFTYRGAKYATLADGEYLYGDYCSGRLWLSGTDANGARVTSQVATFGAQILAFGRDVAGELYVLAATGDVYRLAISRR